MERTAEVVTTSKEERHPQAGGKQRVQELWAYRRYWRVEGRDEGGRGERRPGHGGGGGGQKGAETALKFSGGEGKIGVESAGGRRVPELEHQR